MMLQDSFVCKPVRLTRQVDHFRKHRRRKWISTCLHTLCVTKARHQRLEAVSIGLDAFSHDNFYSFNVETKKTWLSDGLH